MKKYERSKELSYAKCVKLVCNDNIILCNKIANDEDFQECLYSHLFEERIEEIDDIIEEIEVLEDAEKIIDEYCLNDDILEDCEDIEDIKEVLREALEDNMELPEVYQYYLTGCTNDDIRYNQEYLKNALSFVYFEKLDIYVLLVYHWGTSWGYVHGVTVPCDENGMIIKE